MAFGKNLSPDPEQLWVCIDSASVGIGNVPYAVSRGERVREDDPRRLQAPELFLPDGLPTGEYIKTARRRLYERELG